MNEVEHDMKNYPAEVTRYQPNRYQPKPKADVDNDKLRLDKKIPIVGHI